MDWLSRNWKRALIAGCGVVGAVATVVPAAVPAAALCALVVPAVTGAPTLWDGLASILGILKGKQAK